MAGSFSDLFEIDILDHIFMKASFTMPTNLWVGLSTADPLDTGGGLAEPVGNGYARVSTAGADWNAAATGSTSNANDVTFPEATGAGWGTISHFAIFDASTGGQMLAHGDLSASKAVDAGDTAKFTGGTPGDLVVSLD
jgi:hypothetical protein